MQDLCINFQCTHQKKKTSNVRLLVKRESTIKHLVVMQNAVKKLEVNVDIDVFLWTAVSSDAFS